jgi:hypothetical protein
MSTLAWCGLKSFVSPVSQQSSKDEFVSAKHDGSIWNHTKHLRDETTIETCQAFLSKDERKGLNETDVLALAVGLRSFSELGADNL